MAFTRQNNDGTVDGANAYTDVATVRAYWADRGVDLTARTDQELQVAIVNSTTYLDGRYRWVGYQLRRLQGTQWPRGGVTSFLRGLPPALVTATCMLASRALTGKPLMPDPTFDASGGQVVESLKEVGPIKVQTKFNASQSTSASAKTPDYPEVTLTLQSAGLIGSGNSGELGRA